MSSGQLNDVVRHLRRMARLSDAQGLTDGQLLERYVSFRDENAFAALVYRYGRLVRSVCRHILHQEQDTDDVFQVTFLIFACKAASIRRATSVASWLYGVAYRTAMNARRTRSRCREKQREPNAYAHEQPVREASLREVQAILDEEVQRLPEKYRAPFILCCLEGKSRAESAQQLGLKEGTVSSRLAQARKQLQQRLTRRGVVLSAALCAVEVSRNATAASVAPMLVQGTIDGALSFASGNAVVSNLISVEAAALAKEVLRTMSARTLKAVTAALLSISLVTGAGLVTCHALAKKPAAEQQPFSPVEEPGIGKNKASADSKQDNVKLTTIRGRVLDPDGKAMTGAKLYLTKQNLLKRSSDPSFSVQATSGPDGFFQVIVPKTEFAANGQESLRMQIMAIADGYGCDWAAIDPAQKDVTLRLVKDVPLGLRILDVNGRPVIGAKLTVTEIWNPKGDDLGSFLDAVRKNGDREIDKKWYGPLPQQAATTTGRDGRFHLTRIGRERIVLVRIEGPAIATVETEYVMTREAPLVANPKNTWISNGKMEIYGASSDYIAAVSRPIRGVVRDKETGKPLAGVTVGGRHGLARTDEKGRFELLGLRKTATYLLSAEPADGLHFQRHIVLQDTPGLDALTCDIELVRGLIVHGRVTDKETGKPITGARVGYYPLGGNPFVNKLLPGDWEPHSKTTAGSDGSYALTVMPGPGAIVVTAPKRERYMPAAVTLKERKEFFKTPLVDDEDEDGLTVAHGGRAYGGFRLRLHNATVLLEPDTKTEALVRDVALEKPLERTGRVVGPDGRPLVGVRLYSLWPQGSAETLKGAEFTLRGINPRACRSLVFYHKEKNLGYYVSDLRSEPAGPLTIQLQPCGSASGRILRPDGRPAAELLGYLSRIEYHGKRGSIHSEEEGGGQRIRTDKDGRFRVEGLVPGQEYRVSHHSDKRSGFLDLFAPVIVKPGEHKDMDDLTMNRIE